MKLIGWILLACLVIAAAQAIAAALVLALFVGLIWCFRTAPRETFALIALGIFANLMALQPIAVLSLVALIALIATLKNDATKT